MRLLVLGGTAWLGAAVATEALSRGHAVTCLARGSSAPPPPGALWVRADRDRPDAYAEVGAASWDAVLDVSRQPGQVRRAVEALPGVATHCVFVSSGSVYADQSQAGGREDQALHPALSSDVMQSTEAYGEAKVACEQHVRTGFGPDRCLLARVGLIGGPGDAFDRTGYWPLRFARPASPDGAVLVPAADDVLAAVIDVRDLAAWLVTAAETLIAGTLDVVGEALPLPEHLAVARQVAGHVGPLVRAEETWLLERGVQPWAGERSLPLWLADPHERGLNGRDGSAARQRGLVTRPLADTLRDVLDWELGRDPGRARRAGLSDDDERALLRELRAG